MSQLRTEKLWFVCVVLLLCSGNTVAQVKPLSDLVRLYEYDRKASLDVRETSVEERAGVKVFDISYAGSVRGRVPASLIVPAGRGRFAAVVFAACCDGKRERFREEALELAKMGVVSLLVDWNAASRPDYHPKEDGPPRGAAGGADDRDDLIQMVVEFRRGLDFLLSRSDVDAKRIGFVGHSTGGRAASILAGVDKRIKAVVVMASQISATEAWRSNDNPRIVKLRESLPKEEFEQYLQAIAPADAIHYVKYAAPKTMLLQFGRQDDSPNERQARLFFDVASEPKTSKLYDAGHHLNDEARKDRIEWLAVQLMLRTRLSSASPKSSDYNSARQRPFKKVASGSGGVWRTSARLVVVVMAAGLLHLCRRLTHLGVVFYLFARDAVSPAKPKTVIEKSGFAYAATKDGRLRTIHQMQSGFPLKVSVFGDTAIAGRHAVRRKFDPRELQLGVRLSL